MKNHLFPSPVSGRHEGITPSGSVLCRRLLSALLALSVLLCAAGAALAENAGELTVGEQNALDYLTLQLDEAAARLVAVNGEMGDYYSELPALSPADTDSFPAQSLSRSARTCRMHPRFSQHSSRYDRSR